MEMRMASNSSASSSASSMDLPSSGRGRPGRVSGEASSDGEENRKQAFRYGGLLSRYTSSIPGPMPDERKTTPEDRVGAVYDAHYDLLRFIATQRFHVPRGDVRPIIHDVFVAYLRHVAAIGDPRSWLVTAICNACRNYWRDKKESEPMPDTLCDPAQLAEHVTARVDLARLLAAIPDDCRMLLTLRFLEGLDSTELAARCAINAGNARVRVHRCLEALREALAKGTRQ